MRAVIQRVSEASVSVEGTIVGQIGLGFMVLVGAHKEDTEADASLLADRVAGTRLFNDADGKINLSLADVGGAVLAISQFTLYGEGMKNRRPSFVQAAGFEPGKLLFEAFVKELRAKGIPVETGVFGAEMKILQVNEGPVTLILDTR
jgi:D-aminoacyl-tRNA deacylase